MTKFNCILFFTIALSTFSCGGDDSSSELPGIFENDFPQVYSFEKVDVNPSDFYLVNGNSYEDLASVSGQLLEIDLELLGELDEDNFLYYSPITEITLISDSLATLIGVDQDTGEESILLAIYLVEEDNIQFQLSADPANIITFSYNRENKQLIYCLETSIFVHEDRQFESFLITDCASPVKSDIIDNLIAREIANQTLQVNDTLILNISNLVLKFEE